MGASPSGLAPIYFWTLECASTKDVARPATVGYQEPFSERGMAKSSIVKTIGVVAVAIGAIALLTRRAERTPSPEPPSVDRAPADFGPRGGIRPELRVGFRSREGPVSTEPRSTSVWPVRRRASQGMTEEEIDRRDEQERQADEARFTELRATALHAEKPEERVKALGDLDEFDADQIEPILRQALSDPVAGVRIAAINQLSWSRGSEAPFEPLAAAAADANPEVRAEALQALDDIDDPRKVAVIRGALKDPDEDVRSRAESYAFGYDDGGDEPDDNSDADE
jgi:HEAT repeats